MDLNTAKKFLEVFPNYVFAYLNPKKKGFVHVNPTEEGWQLVEEKNSGNLPENKCGIYFTPNGDYRFNFKEKLEEYSGIRQEKLAKNIYTFLVDIDVTPEEKEITYETLMTAWIEPSIVVETYKGFHIYFLLDKPQEVTKESLKTFKEVEQQLIRIFNGDPQCKDLARVLRVPGFKYWKDGTGEFVIKLRYFKSDVRYKWSAFKQLLEEEIEYTKVEDGLMKAILSTPLENKHKIDWENFFEKVNQLPVCEVLSKLYPQYKCLSNGAIKENGKFTNGYKWNKNGNYVNSFSPHDERPRGMPWHIIKKYCDGNIKKIVQTIEDNFGIKLEYKDDYSISEYSVKLINNSYEAGKFEEYEQLVKDLLNGKIVDNFQLQIGNTFFEMDFKNPSVQAVQNSLKADQPLRLFISNGVVLPIKKEEDAVICLMYKGIGDMKIKKIEKLDRAINLRKELAGPGITIRNLDTFFADFLEFLYKYSIFNGLDILEDYGVSYINNMKEKKIITPNNKGEINLEKKYILSPNNLGVFNFLKIDDNKDDKIISLSDAWDLYKNGYSKEITLSIFASMLLAYEIDILKKLGINTNYIMFLSGQTQTGKTTLLNSVMNLFNYRVEVSASTTPFSLLSAFVFKGPVRLKEYRNNSYRDNKLYDLLRNAYDFGQDSRGTQQQKVILYRQNAKVFIDGQTPLTDEATRNRSLVLSTSEIKKKKGDKKVFTKLKGKTVLPEVLQPIDLNVFANHYEKNAEFVEEILKDLEKKIGKDLPDRDKQIYQLLSTIIDVYIARGVFSFDDKLLVKDVILEDRKFKKVSEFSKFFRKIISILSSGGRFSKITAMADERGVQFMNIENVLKEGEAGLVYQYCIEKYDWVELTEGDAYISYEDLMEDTNVFKLFLIAMFKRDLYGEIFSGMKSDILRKIFSAFIVKIENSNLKNMFDMDILKSKMMALLDYDIDVSFDEILKSNPTEKI